MIAFWRRNMKPYSNNSPGIVVACLGEYVHPLVEGERPVVVGVCFLERILLALALLNRYGWPAVLSRKLKEP